MKKQLEHQIQAACEMLALFFWYSHGKIPGAQRMHGMEHFMHLWSLCSVITVFLHFRLKAGFCEHSIRIWNKKCSFQFHEKNKIRENRRTAKENLRIFDRRISHGLTIYLLWIFLVSDIWKIFQQMNWQRTVKWLCVLLGKHLPERRRE